VLIWVHIYVHTADKVADVLRYGGGRGGGDTNFIFGGQSVNFLSHLSARLLSAAG
jgi:hypothetical protein